MKNKYYFFKLLLALLAFMALKVPDVMGQLNWDYRTIWGTFLFDEPYPYLKIDTLNPENVWQVGYYKKEKLDPIHYKHYTDNIWRASLCTDTLLPYPPSNHSTFDIIVERDTRIQDCWSYFGMTIMHQYDFNDGHAGGYIEISYDNGQTWTNIVETRSFERQVDFSWFYTPEDTITGGIPAFTGLQNEWITASYQIDYPKEIQSGIYSVIIRFNFLSDSTESTGEGWLIDNISVLMDDLCGVGINDNKTDNEISLYPNPVINSSQLKIPPNMNFPCIISVIDLQGNILLNDCAEMSGSIPIEKRDYKAGTYFIKITDNNKQTQTIKFVVL